MIVLSRAGRVSNRNARMDLKFEQKMLKDVKRSIGSKTLKLFVAKRLVEIVEKWENVEQNIMDFYDIRYAQ